LYHDFTGGATTDREAVATTLVAVDGLVTTGTVAVVAMEAVATTLVVVDGQVTTGMVAVVATGAVATTLEVVDMVAAATTLVVTQAKQTGISSEALLEEVNTCWLNNN
jgi:hypothetical protein